MALSLVTSRLGFFQNVMTENSQGSETTYNLTDLCHWSMTSEDLVFILW